MNSSVLTLAERLAAVVCVAFFALGGGMLADSAITAGARKSSRPILLIASSYEGTVEVMDGRTFRPLGRPLNVIPEGRTPVDPAQRAIYPTVIRSRGEVNYAQEVQASPDGATVYVSRGYLGDVAAFSLATRKELWRTQMPALRADHLAVSRDGRRLFVSALPGTRVYALNAKSGRPEGSYPAGDWPHVLVLSPDGRYVLSGSLGNQLLPYGHDTGIHQLTVADARTLRVVHTYRFEAGVRPFAFVPHSRQLVLQLSYLNGFVMFDPITGRRRTKRLPLRGPATTLLPQDYPNQAAHHGIAVSGDGRVICAGATISNYVALVALRGTSRATILPVGQAPAEALTSLDGHLCLVLSRGPTALRRTRVKGLDGDTLSVISYARRREVARVRVGVHPQAETEVRVQDGVLREGGFLP